MLKVFHECPVKLGIIILHAVQQGIAEEKSTPVRPHPPIKRTTRFGHVPAWVGLFQAGCAAGNINAERPQKNKVIFIITPVPVLTAEILAVRADYRSMFLNKGTDNVKGFLQVLRKIFFTKPPCLGFRKKTTGVNFLTHITSPQVT